MLGNGQGLQEQSFRPEDVEYIDNESDDSLIIESEDSADWTILSESLLLNIALYLDEQDIRSCRLVCQSWRKVFRLTVTTAKVQIAENHVKTVQSYLADYITAFPAIKELDLEVSMRRVSRERIQVLLDSYFQSLQHFPLVTICLLLDLNSYNERRVKLPDVSALGKWRHLQHLLVQESGWRSQQLRVDAREVFRSIPHLQTLTLVCKHSGTIKARWISQQLHHLQLQAQRTSQVHVSRAKARLAAGEGVPPRGRALSTALPESDPFVTGGGRSSASFLVRHARLSPDKRPQAAYLLEVSSYNCGHTANTTVGAARPQVAPHPLAQQQVERCAGAYGRLLAGHPQAASAGCRDLSAMSVGSFFNIGGVATRDAGARDEAIDRWAADAHQAAALGPSSVYVGGPKARDNVDPSRLRVSRPRALATQSMPSSIKGFEGAIGGGTGSINGALTGVDGDAGSDGAGRGSFFAVTALSTPISLPMSLSASTMVGGLPSSGFVRGGGFKAMTSSASASASPSDPIFVTQNLRVRLTQNQSLQSQLTSALSGVVPTTTITSLVVEVLEETHMKSSMSGPVDLAPLSALETFVLLVGAEDAMKDSQIVLLNSQRLRTLVLYDVSTGRWCYNRGGHGIPSRILDPVALGGLRKLVLFGFVLGQTANLHALAHLSSLEELRFEQPDSESTASVVGDLPLTCLPKSLRSLKLHCLVLTHNGTGAGGASAAEAAGSREGQAAWPLVSAPALVFAPGPGSFGGPAFPNSFLAPPPAGSVTQFSTAGRVAEPMCIEYPPSGREHGSISRAGESRDEPAGPRNLRPRPNSLQQRQPPPQLPLLEELYLSKVKVQNLSVVGPCPRLRRLGIFNCHISSGLDGFLTGSTGSLKSMALINTIPPPAPSQFSDMAATAGEQPQLVSGPRLRSPQHPGAPGFPGPSEQLGQTPPHFGLNFHAGLSHESGGGSFASAVPSARGDPSGSWTQPHHLPPPSFPPQHAAQPQRWGLGGAAAAHTAVALGSMSVDEQLIAVARCGGLRQLQLVIPHGSVSLAGLTELRGMRRLEDLDLALPCGLSERLMTIAPLGYSGGALQRLTLWVDWRACTDQIKARQLQALQRSLQAAMPSTRVEWAASESSQGSWTGLEARIFNAY